MKTVSKKLLSLLLVAIMLVSAVPFQAFATEVDETQSSDIIDDVAAAGAVEGPMTVTFYDEDGSTVITDLDGNDCIVEVKYNKTIASKYFPNNYLTLVGQDDPSMVFSHWVDMATGLRFNTSEKITRDYDLQAVYKYPSVKVTFKANGGTADYTSKYYEYGQTYGELPNATREHHVFDGWFTADGTQVTAESQISSKIAYTLTAQWTKKNYKVIYQAYGENGWEDVEAYWVEANTAPSAANGNFPSSTANYNTLDGFTIDGWVMASYNAETGAYGTFSTFKAGSTKITTNVVVIRPRYEGNVTLHSYVSGYTKSFAVVVGERIGKLPNPGPIDGYTFAGWYTEDNAGGTLISTRANLSNTSAHDVYDPAVHGFDFYASWVKAAKVHLYIYTDKNLTTCYTYKYYDAPLDEAFDLNLINMYEVYPYYSKYAGGTNSGWCTEAQWKNYCAGVPYTPIASIPADDEYVGSVKLGDGDNEFYIMLEKNTSSNNNTTTGTGSTGTNNYNNNSSTADPSNPATGDMIGMSMFVMVASAAAAAFLFLSSKKRMVK